ncbi:helix-turn-helix transcriptional regulator [Bacillus sp. ISL-53]|nr:helix-turn-helix transcriptional regulator [Bacillus sp. ISL-53]
MAIGRELAEARKRQGYSQEQLSLDLPVSRESLAKYETGARRLPVDMRQPIAEAVDDIEFYFATWSEAAGEVSIPYLNGDYIDQHPASMVFLVKRETDEALEQLKKVCWVKPIHTRTDSEKEEINRLIFELLDSAASTINLVAIVCREYGFSMNKVFKQWRLTLKARRYKK